MFELHIEFSNDSLIFDFENRDDIEEMCRLLKNVSGFLQVYNKGVVHFVNTNNVLYFYVKEITPVKKYGEEEVCF